MNVFPQALSETEPQSSWWQRHRLLVHRVLLDFSLLAGLSIVLLLGLTIWNTYKLKGLMDQLYPAVVNICTNSPVACRPPQPQPPAPAPAPPETPK